MTTHRPAEAFAPGEFLLEELEERGWSQSDFAAITGKNLSLIYGIIKGTRPITIDTARAFADALGTSAEYWLNLEASYRLWQAGARDDGKSEIVQRARLYVFPIREMSRRGWIDNSATLAVLEHQLERFFGKESLEEIPWIDHAAKKTAGSMLTPAQLAWLFRAKQLAEAQDVSPFSEKKLRSAIESMRLLLHGPEETRQVARILATAGVRYVLVEGLPSQKIDGVCFWLKKTAPVVAMSLRYDRIDNFWFVLRHECEHVLRGDAKGEHLEDVEPDSELQGSLAPDASALPEQERKANEAAADFCVPAEKLQEFIDSTRPYYAESKIRNFAGSVGVHPGLVAGQLHHRRELPYTHMKKLLVRIRPFVLETAFADGWGIVPRLRSE